MRRTFANKIYTAQIRVPRSVYGNQNETMRFVIRFPGHLSVRLRFLGVHHWVSHKCSKSITNNTKTPLSP